MSYQYFLTTKHPKDSTQDLLIFSTTTGSGLGLKKFFIEKALSSYLKEKISLGNITDVLVVSIQNKEVLSWIPPISLTKADGKDFTPLSFITKLDGLHQYLSIQEIKKHC